MPEIKRPTIFLQYLQCFLSAWLTAVCLNCHNPFLGAGDEVNASVFIATGSTFKKHGVKKHIGQFVSQSYGLTCINLNPNNCCFIAISVLVEEFSPGRKHKNLVLPM